MAEGTPARTLAALFDIDERTLKLLASSGVVVKSGRDDYDLAKSVQGYVKYLRKASEECDLGTLCQLLAIGHSRVRQLVHRGVIPEALSHGRYSAIPAVSGYIKDLRRQAEGSSKGYMVERARLTQAKADVAVLNRAVLEKQLLPAEETIKVLNAAHEILRTRFLAIPSRAAAQWSSFRTAAELEQCIYGEICEALEAISKLDIVALVGDIFPMEDDAIDGDDDELFEAESTDQAIN